MAPPKPSGKAKKVKATPAPPVGPGLGSKGVNIMAFSKDYNPRTVDEAGFVIPVEMTWLFGVVIVDKDKSFTFILKTPPASVLLLKAAVSMRFVSCSNNPNLMDDKTSQEKEKERGSILILTTNESIEE
ncbi:hypothetical protein SADUNF_Sadunf11G0111900 [Salix dunnii]|uniref:Large ribosomal subunit protein uL11 N-terminal domain-containing protein n=1 Tax=Salix dunnii TaxID=1413687 RepID=A0A835JR59_9ROSI|nr:hypothetical protein SADUNF_Sadunf11G0111900 [Salix dunnii]